MKIPEKILKITPLRRGLVQYLDDEQLHILKKKCEIEVLRFIGTYHVLDANCLAFCRNKIQKYVFTEKSARYNAVKHSRLLYNESLLDIYTVKYDDEAGRGSNIYCINENGYRLLGIPEERRIEFNLINIEQYLYRSQYAIYRSEQLIQDGSFILDTLSDQDKIHIKYSSNEDIFNEYIFLDHLKIERTLQSFITNHIPYNDRYVVLINSELRRKELNRIIKLQNVEPLCLDNIYKLEERRNSRNSLNPRPKLNWRLKV